MKLALAGAILSMAAIAAAARKPEPAAGRANLPGAYLDVGGARLYYETCGSGPAIVLLHDGLLHSVVWDGEWDALCRSRRVVRYDRRGYGRSAPPDAPFLQTDDLAGLLKHLGIERATLVGCSSGSAVAIDFAIHHRRSGTDRLDARGGRRLIEAPARGPKTVSLSSRSTRAASG